MKIKLHLLFLICFLFFSNLVISQQIKDVALDSSQYLFPQFTDGVIILKDGNEWRGKLNYDTSLDQMQFLGTNNEILYIGEPDNVKIVVINNRNFIYNKNYFVELLSNDAVTLCLRVHLKRSAEKIGAYGGTSPTASIQSLSSIGLSDGRITKLSANEEVSFKTERIFYVMNNGKTRMVLNQNDLLKCFSSKKELIKQELERQNTKFNSIDSMKKIIAWINANGIKD